MIKKLLACALVIGIFTACEEEGGMEELAEEQSAELLSTAIEAEDLPQASLDYINANYADEIIVSAYLAEGAESNFYEATLTNDLALVFDEEGKLLAFGAGARLDCEGRPRHHKPGGDGKKRPKDGEKPPKEEGMRNDMDGEKKPRPPKPVEIEVTDLPTAAQDYLSTHFADTAVLKVLEMTTPEELVTYHALVIDTGAVVFDADGAFLEIKQRPDGQCLKFEELDVSTLSTEITTYIDENYPDAVVERARQGEKDGVTEVHVVVEETGVLIFDAEGNFLKLHECHKK